MSPAANPAVRDRLRIAIQKSGRLSEPARALLASSGLSWRESRDKLFCYGESLPVDLLLVRDDDIPGLIADGVCDLGIVGRNELEEQAGARARMGLPPAYRALREAEIQHAEHQVQIAARMVGADTSLVQKRMNRAVYNAVELLREMARDEWSDA